MAQKRMFDKTVTRSDIFLEMPDSTQNLYFHLSMEADDDGFVDNWKSIMRMIGKKEDDLKILIAKSFLIPFESGIIVIKHWRINNYLRKDRYHETKHLKEKAMLKVENNEEYSLKEEFGIPTVNREKNRIEKNSIVYNILPQNPFCEEGESSQKTSQNSQLFDYFWKNYPKKKDKGNAEKWFDKHKPSEELVNLMVKQIERLKDTQDWKKNDGQFIPYPSTWLNSKGWEDEFETDTEKEQRIDKEIMEGFYGT